MEKKQTAVEWMWHHFNVSITKPDESMFDKAKAMEKQQMIEFAKGFWYWGNGSDAPPCYNEDVEKYYNKVYGK